MRLPSLLLVALAACLTACSRPDPQPPPQVVSSQDKPLQPSTRLPNKIILMIGDGMGNPVTSAAAYAKGSPLAMQQMPYIGFIRTHEFEFVTTDSAASATAFATGKKAHYEAVSVTPGTSKAEEQDPAHHMQHTVEIARAAGWRTGLVATSRIVHATPAAFAAHREHRQSYEDIALDVASAGVDVLLGAGSRYFDPAKREDGKDLVGQLKAAGYQFATTPDEVRALSAAQGKGQRLVGLLHDKDMPSMQQGGRAMSLAELTGAALDALDEGPDSKFFLMVEGSQIDWEEHDMDGAGAVAETLDFDEAVAVARRYAAQHPDALVIVTADHETGGLGLIDPSVVERYAKPLGGLAAANAATQVAQGREAGPDVTQLMALGDGPLKPPEQADARLALTFGYLSAASRPLWKEASEFLAVHTATMVPLYADGAQAEAASRLRDNAELGKFIHGLIRQQPLTPEASALAQPAPGARPKNVILFVGDGMGLAAVTTSYYARGESAMLGLPVTGLVSTHGADRLVNDSAATATALSTGLRTRYGAVGAVPGPDGALVGAQTVLEAAEARGLKTGLVTTTQLTHATPAAFYAHETSRGSTADIAAAFVALPQLVKGADGVDIAFAGGAADFSPALREQLNAQGAVVEAAWGAALPAGKRVVRLLADKGLDDATRRLTQASPQPTLAAMTKQALDGLTALDAQQQGFFLLVEGGQIDWALHDMEQGPRLLHEIEDMDRAVAEAVAFARRRGDTLILVTADHDHTLSLLDNHYGFKPGHCGVMKACGGAVEFPALPVALGKIAHGEGLQRADLQHQWPPAMMVQYGYLPQAARYAEGKISGPHAAHFVPLFAYGPGAQAFGGYHDQPQVGAMLLAWAQGR